MGDGLNGVRRGPLVLFPALQDLPVYQDLFTGVGLHGAAEHMGMAEDHFLGDLVDHIVHGEPPQLLFNLSVKYHLHQDVAQLLAHGMGIIPVQGVQDLIGLLQKIPPDGLVGLLGVPGTAARGAQQSHDLQKVLPAIATLTLKIYHRLPAFARKFNGVSLEISKIFTLSAEV